MAKFNNKYFRNKKTEKTRICSCGELSFLRVRKNYPFGKNSRAKITKLFRCNSCDKVILLNNYGGK